MSELPDGWARAPLGDLLKGIVGGGTPSKANEGHFRGSIPFMTVKDMHERFIGDTQDHITESALTDSASTLVPADTLIVASRMSLGKIARPIVPVAINQDLKALFLHDGIHKTYIEYAWRANESAIKSKGTGTTVKGIRLEDIRGLEVAVAPMAEQTRIADQLDNLLTRIQACNDRLNAIPALLKRFRQAVLKAASTGTLTEDWRASQAHLNSAEARLLALTKKRPPAMPSGPRASDKLPQIPPNWRWTNLLFLLMPDEPFCYGVVQPGVDDPLGIPLVRAGDLKNGTVLSSGLRRIAAEVDATYKRSRLQGGELLVTSRNKTS